MFESAIEFMQDLGIFRVILPFLLVFTIVFAILEKTRILGVEEIDKKKYTRKNLNAMVAFVIGFFVIASKELVRIISETASNVILLLLGSVLFLMLVGSFSKESEEGFFLEGGWKTLFFVIMFVGIVLIFLNAIQISGQSAIVWAFTSASIAWDSQWVSMIIVLGVLIGLMAAITSGGGPKKSKSD